MTQYQLACKILRTHINFAIEALFLSEMTVARKSLIILFEWQWHGNRLRYVQVVISFFY